MTVRGDDGILRVFRRIVQPYLEARIADSRVGLALAPFNKSRGIVIDRDAVFVVEIIVRRCPVPDIVAHYIELTAETRGIGPAV